MNKDRLLRWVTISSLFLVPFNIKKFFLLLTKNETWFPLEFSSIFLYFSEIIILILFLFLLFKKRKEILQTSMLVWPTLLFFLLSALSILVSDTHILSLFFCLHLLVSIFFFISIATAISLRIISIRDAMKVLAVSSLLQAEIAILQFINQGSIGLRFFGEETISLLSRNIARIDVFGSTFIRSYGTFPHPNILGGFLVLGVVAWIYLFSLPSKQHGIFHRSLSIIGLFVVLVGLLFSFSRSAWIAAAITLISCVVVLFKNKLKHAAREIVLMSMIFAVVLFGVFGWMVFSRGEIKNDSAVNERVVYVNIALDMIADYPFGVGFGNGMVRAEQEGRYDSYGLTNKATHQPVHNIYLLITQEIGVVGIIVFLFSILTLLFYKKRKIHTPDTLFVYIMIVSLLFVGFFDHYLITINSGRLMFFLVLGIMAGLLQKNEEKSL